MPAWEDIPEDERAFQARLVEVYAGFFEHTDVQVGKLIAELEERGIRDNTMVIYILSDNGASAEVLEKVNGVIFAMGAYSGAVSLYALDGELYYEYSALILKRDKFKAGVLPAGDVTIAFEMRTPIERAAPAELKSWINGKEAVTGKLQRTVPAFFTASETFDVGMDTASPAWRV